MTTCREKVYSVLSRGGKWTNVEIEKVLEKEFHEPNQNNTIAKNLHFLMKDGLVVSNMQPGATCCAYELIYHKTKEDDLIDRIKLVIKNHPTDHIEYKKSMLQIEQLEKRKTMVA